MSSKNFNKVLLIGNIGASPELRQTKDGTCVTNFALATTERRKTAQNGIKAVTQWHKIVAWGDVAKYGCRNIEKGNLVFIEGTIVYTKNDQGQVVTEIKALKIQNMSPSKRERVEEIVPENTDNIELDEVV